MRRNLNIKHICNQILDWRDDQPYTDEIFQVVLQRVKKSRRKSFVRKYRNKIIYAYEFNIAKP